MQVNFYFYYYCYFNKFFFGQSPFITCSTVFSWLLFVLVIRKINYFSFIKYISVSWTIQLAHSLWYYIDREHCRSKFWWWFCIQSKSWLVRCMHCFILHFGLHHTSRRIHQFTSLNKIFFVSSQHSTWSQKNNFSYKKLLPCSMLFFFSSLERKNKISKKTFNPNVIWSLITYTFICLLKC